MRVFPLLLLVGCGFENELNSKDKDVPTFDEGDSVPFDTETDSEPPPPDEACNGYDDNGDGVVDEGFPDKNANGRADCLDETCPALNLAIAGTVAINEACAGTTSSTVEVTDDPWSAQIKWQFNGPAISPNTNQSYVQPVIGNLDDDNGDGDVDEDDIPDVVLSLYGGTEYIVAIDGATGLEKWAVTGSSRGNLAIADVDADGVPDVVGASSSGYTILLNGADGSNKWTSSDMATALGYYMITVADLDMDGYPEVIDNNVVMDGQTGVTLWEMTADRTNCPYTMAAVGDIDQNDNDQEVLWCGAAYDSNGTELWDTGERGNYGMWPIIIQADGDDEAEVGFVGQSWSLWEDDGSNIYTVNYSSSQKHPGPPCAGDFDGDGVAEVAFPSYQNFVVYELDGSELWSVAMDDTSGLAGCSGYDVNGDGPLEVLFADQSTFKIFDGSTGATLYTYSDHRSGTVFEYPSVADIDGDGHAEIVFAANGYGSAGAGVTALEHTGSGWPAAGTTWNVHDFAITNINPDGSVPQFPEASWLKYNVYRARVAVDDPSSPDLIVSITDVCVADCTYGPAALAIAASNEGGADVAAGVMVAIYAEDATGPRLVTTVSLPAIAAGTRLEGIEVPIDPTDVGDRGFRAVVDDDGTGISDVSECDETNNVDLYTDSLCP